MKQLKDYTPEELRAELERREKEKNSPPSVLPVIDWSGVINQAKSITKTVADGKHIDDNDDAHYLYEEVMKAVYGKDYFKWFNVAIKQERGWESPMH